MSLKEVRIGYGLSQIEAATLVGVPVRTYRRYEIDETYGSIVKRNAFISILKEQCEITEEKGILVLDYIKNKCKEVFDSYDGKIIYCFLFGSYAKGYAKDESDVDLLVSTNITGFEYFGLVEELRTKLCKKVDLLRIVDLKDNIELIDEIIKDGIKIYG